MYKQLQQRDLPEAPVNISTLRTMKAAGEPIACLTAYDASFAMLVDRAGADLVLVGDSVGMVVQGHDTTVPVTVTKAEPVSGSAGASIETTGASVSTVTPTADEAPAFPAASVATASTV